MIAKRILAIGELLWDLLPGGQRLGGAPLNVVAHLRQMGHEVALLSGVGDDERGRAALAEASELGVGTQFMRVVPGVPTGIVRVELDPTGIARFDIVSPAAYEHVADDRASVAAAARYAPDALVFGTLAQRSRFVRHATTVVIEANPEALRVYDVNLREGCWHPELVDELLSCATVVKLNDDEVRVLGPVLDLPADSDARFALSLMERYSLTATCVTRGANGALLCGPAGLVEADVRPVQVVDTVGAGDAFTAGLVDGLLAGKPAEEVVAVANRLGALVASRPGAIPRWHPGELALPPREDVSTSQVGDRTGTRRTPPPREQRP